MKLPFINLHAQYKKLEFSIQSRINKVLEHGQYIMGPEVTELEEKLASYVDSKYCIGVANGTDALLIALMALDISLGDEIIVPDFTFIAPVEMVSLLGAKPIFVDINPNTYNIDINILEEAITDKTKAIIPVNLYGQCADFDEINNIANKYNLYVIEDAAQSFGATYKGRHSCNLSTIACTSFFPSKPLGCYGDGGACFTNDESLAEKMRCIMNHGQEGRYNHVRLGLNSRLDTIQAAILLSKLENFPWELERRAELANLYSSLLSGYVDIPYIEPYNSSVFAQYTIGCDNREKIIKYLSDSEIPIAVHYPKSLHKQPVFSDLNALECTKSKLASESVISLPFSPYLDEKDLKIVAEAVAEATKI